MIDDITIDIDEEHVMRLLDEFSARTVKCKCFGGKSGQVFGGLKKLGGFRPLHHRDCSACQGKGHIFPVQEMNITLIAAVANNGAIGKDNDLLWKIPEDLKWFKQKTLNKTVVMGRKTYESIGRTLPNRTNVILTRDVNYNVAGATVIGDLDRFLLDQPDRSEEVMIIGGGELYQKAIHYANRLYITEVDDDPAADVFFPEFNRKNWVEEDRVEREGSPNYSFCTYVKIKNKMWGK